MNIFKKLYLEHYIKWHCDNCNAYLNKQSAFKVDTGSWTCTNCVFENDVTAEYVGKGNKLEQQRKLEEERKKKAEQEEKEQKENLRKQTICSFESPITKSVFETIVFKVAENYKRLTVKICDTTVHGTVRSVSGISFWDFSMDFNDFGIITGNYFALEYDNEDSDIPNAFCEEVKNEIVNYINQMSSK